jgi:hypothetical protein
MNKLFFLFLVVVPFYGLQAQELNCQVNIVVDNKVEVSSTEQEIINQMKQSITEIMNNTAWTKDKFKIEERINCNLQIQIREIPATGAYRGDIQVSSVRPAFNSNYNSTLFNFQDENFQASFSRGAVLNYVPNQYRDNLTSILAFYAYFIIAMDYDSFSLKGGTPYFQEAQQIVTLAQTGGAAGWKSSESNKRNRFYLVDNMLQPVFEPFRVCIYQYHRSGIDQLYDKKEEGKKAISAALNSLSPIMATRPNTVNVVSFLFGKTTELKNIFSDSELKEKQDLVNLLKKLDPANNTLYSTILD